MARNEFEKTASEVLDYTLDFSDDLEVGETISSVVLTVPTGITNPAHSNDNTTVTIWLSGGTLAAWYTVTATVVTSAGRTYQRCARLNIVDVTKRP